MINETIVLAGLILILIGILGSKKIVIKEVTIGDLTIAQRAIVTFLGIFVLIASFWPSVILIYLQPPNSTIPAVTSTPTLTSLPSPTPALISPPATNCFPEVPENRTKVFEAGIHLDIFEPYESKDEPMVFTLTELKKPIGYIKLFFYPDDNYTKIAKVVDPKCQTIEEYSNNIDATKDKHMLADWDTVKIKFGNYYYYLTIGYEGSKTPPDVQVNFDPSV